MDLFSWSANQQCACFLLNDNFQCHFRQRSWILWLPCKWPEILGPYGLSNVWFQCMKSAIYKAVLAVDNGLLLFFQHTWAQRASMLVNNWASGALVELSVVCSQIMFMKLLEAREEKGPLDNWSFQILCSRNLTLPVGSCCLLDAANLVTRRHVVGQMEAKESALLIVQCINVHRKRPILQQE